MNKKIGILTGGGDCPGLNAVIRAAAKTAFAHDYELIGFLDGYSGIIDNRYVSLNNNHAISGLLHKGGTILGTNNRDNPFHYPVKTETGVEYRDMSDVAVDNLKSLEITALIAIGGDGTLGIARDLSAKGIKVVGIPKTIDNDLEATDQTFGFDTAVTTATDALDKLHSTAESHHRVMVLEVMGRYAGWIALQSGLAGGADVILIPEIPWSYEKIKEKILNRQREGKLFSIIVVAEGAKLPDGEMVVRERIPGSGDPIRLGGIGQIVGKKIEELTGIETRITVLGHIQRGGSPTPFDRVLATRFGVHAVELIFQGKYGRMVCLKGSEISSVDISQATAKTRTVPPYGNLVKTARAIGIYLGDD